GERVLVRVDDVVEEMRAQVHRRPQALPVDVSIRHEQTEVDRSEVADVVGEQWLLAARVRGFVAAEARHGVVVVGPVDEVDAGLPRLPGAVDDRAAHVAGIQLAHHLAAARVDEAGAGRTKSRARPPTGAPAPWRAGCRRCRFGRWTGNRPPGARSTPTAGPAAGRRSSGWASWASIPASP